MISFKPNQAELGELYSKLIEDTEECRVSDKNYFFPDFIIVSPQKNYENRCYSPLWGMHTEKS